MVRIHQEKKAEPRYKYRGKAVPSVTEVLSGEGLYPDYAKMNPHPVEEKRQIGTDGHSYVAAKFMKKPRVQKRIRDNGSERLNHYLDVFDYWFEEMVEDYEILCCEKQLFYHTIFAGTPDFFGYLKLRNLQPSWTLADWKFRSTSVLADRLQTMAYSFMAQRTFKEDFSGPVARMTVLIPEDKVIPYICRHDDDNEDWLNFQAAVRMYTLKKKYKII